MTTSINLPDDLSRLLRKRARRQHLSLEQYVIDALREISVDTSLALDKPQAMSELEELVKRIGSMPTNPSAITEPGGWLAEVLAAQPEDPTFVLDEWERDWSDVERELRRIEMEDALADLRAGT